MVTKEFKLTSKGQVTIPEAIRKVLGVHPGDSVFFVSTKSGVELRPFLEEPMSIFDLGKKYRTIPKEKVTIDDMNNAIKNGWKKIRKKNS